MLAIVVQCRQFLRQLLVRQPAEPIVLEEALLHRIVVRGDAFHRRYACQLVQSAVGIYGGLVAVDKDGEVADLIASRLYHHYQPAQRILAAPFFAPPRILGARRLSWRLRCRARWITKLVVEVLHASGTARRRHPSDAGQSVINGGGPEAGIRLLAKRSRLLKEARHHIILVLNFVRRVSLGYCFLPP